MALQPWPLPKFNVTLTNFKELWSALNSEDNFPALSATIVQRQPLVRSTQLLVPALPPIPIVPGLNLSFSIDSFILNAANWDKNIGPRYESKAGVVRLSCHAQRAVKLYIRRVSRLLKHDNLGSGVVEATHLLNDVVIDVKPGVGSILVSVRKVLRDFLGEDPNNIELQHFFRMIDESADWDGMDFHPFLQHTEGRLLLPVCCVLLLEEYDDLKDIEKAVKPPEKSDHIRWEREFNNWFKINYSLYPFIVNFRDWAVTGNVDLFRHCWNFQKEDSIISNPAQPPAQLPTQPPAQLSTQSPAQLPIQPQHDRVKRPGQLVRFGRALAIHLNNFREFNQKLSEAEIEQEYSIKFFYINLALFEYVLKKRGANLSLLENPRTYCQFGLLKKKKIDVWFPKFSSKPPAAGFQFGTLRQ